MSTLLFVNACVRSPKNSRTAQLANAFFEEYAQIHNLSKIETVDLASLKLPPLTAEMVEKRDELINTGNLSAPPELALANQFAQADKIVVAAPYWDLSFPSILKIYVEHISVRNITFRYHENQLQGLCNASNMLYVTTAGGSIEGNNFGYDYFLGLCRQFGIGGCALLAADNLDLDYIDLDRAMAGAMAEARIAAKYF